MRRACQWSLLLVLTAGCAGAPGGTPSRTSGGDSAAAPVAEAPPEPGHMRADEVPGFLASHPEALLLDVRNPDEWNDDLGHIEGARQIPLPELPGRLNEIAAWKGKPVVVVCRSGRRSLRAASMLAGAGYRDVFNLEGGMAAWRQGERPSGPSTPR